MIKRNQLSCAIPLQKLYALIDSYSKEYKQLNPESTQREFVEKLISLGYKHLKAVKAWEPSHYKMMRESAKENSFMKSEKMIEITEIIRNEPNVSLAQLDEKLGQLGMDMSIVEKISFLSTRCESNRLVIGRLLKAKKE